MNASAMTSSTGVLPFLLGADFSNNNFQLESFPNSIGQMKGLKWLRLNKTHLDWIPEEFSGLESLEKLSLSHNNLTSLHGELICLNNLKFLNCSHNRINGTDVPDQLFNLRGLTVLDLSHNNLNLIPRCLENCVSLTVLNLKHNNLKSISEQLFVQLTELTHLDLSHNQLKTVPPQIGRLHKLKTLILSHNPLEEHKMKQIERLITLEALHLANTHRDLTNTPANLGDLVNLIELDLSSNNLNRIPDGLNHLEKLKRLNLSDNQLEKIPASFGGWWPVLESLNLSSNLLKEIPNSLCKMCNIKRLYLNDNQLVFEGLPAALGKLHQLEVFMAARNSLEAIPESIFRCGRLKKLILTSNNLITLPDTIHLLYDLEALDLSNNPQLQMPPKPTKDSTRNSEFYNIDFSLKTLLRLAGDPESANLPQQPSPVVKDPIARKLRLRKRLGDGTEQESNQAKVLKGMKDLALDKNNPANQSDYLELNVKPKRWDEVLEKPPIDYSEFFDETTGQMQGLTMWEIENFCPVLMDVSLHGKFFDADCYIVLSTHVDENLSLNWKIFYWIGSECTLDKKACSAIHAVGLRNHLNAQCRTIREEQGEESDEFLALFPDGIDYVKGARTSSGFFVVEEVELPHKMLRLHEVMEVARQLHLETVALSSNSLDSRFVFLIDIGDKIYIWNGMKSKNTTKQKARLLGEKLNKEERRNKAELVFCDQGDEPPELLEELNLSDPLPRIPFKTIDLDDKFDTECYVPPKPVLYQVNLGIGFIELIQVHFKRGDLVVRLLNPVNTYILDCFTDVFVWLGRKSSRWARYAALKLAQELFSMLNRPEFAKITSCLQGTESQLLKSKFRDWDDVIAVDYTRTAESVSKTGADLAKWMSEQEVKIDLASLFTPRISVFAGLPEEEVQQLIATWMSDLELVEVYILEKGRYFAKLPESEVGHFYTHDCYVFLCRDYIPQDDYEECNQIASSGTILSENGNSQDISNEDFKCLVYFWQGRQASNMGWLTFTFGLQKKFEALFSHKLEVVKIHQQQENLKFLSLFKQKFIIHEGKRNASQKIKPISLFHLRANSHLFTLRCIEIKPESTNLNSGFSFVLITEERVYIWVGSKSDPREAKIAEEIALEKFNSPDYLRIEEGHEPEEFWSALGGRQIYDTDASYMQHNRLFRCSNDLGYFSISEKCTDFCQDDLSDDDIMILDNGSQVFLWIGPKSSEVEVKLAYKSAQVYVQNLKLKDQNPRQLLLTCKGKESKKFTRCFHAWTDYKVLKDPRFGHKLTRVDDGLAQVD